MGGYTLAATLDRPYEETVRSVRDGLAGQGFGVLTQIDLRATLKNKLDVDVALDLVGADARQRLTAMLAALTEES